MSREAFDQIDDNGDGAISREEMHSFLTSSGYSDEAASKKVEEIFTQNDLDEPDKISWEEWEFFGGLVDVDLIQENDDDEADDE